MSRDALVVGISTYEYDRLNGLNAPAEDAEAIARLLTEYGEFKVRRLPEIKNKEDNQEKYPLRVGRKTKVSLIELEEALEQLFKPKGNSIPETALFYFSGHGLRKERGIQEGFLATSNVNPDIGFYGLSLQWLRRLLEESPIRQQIIWLDCCYSGELLNFAEADPGDKGKGAIAVLLLHPASLKLLMKRQLAVMEFLQQHCCKDLTPSDISTVG